jgi:antitoxin HicB
MKKRTVTCVTDIVEGNVMKYPAVVRPLDESGGGYLVEYLDLPGCIADGDTIEEAMANAEQAAAEWIEAAKEMGRDIPEPSTIDKFSGKWVQRVPKSLHMKLALEAKKEGVSLNALAISILAEGLGKRRAAA